MEGQHCVLLYWSTQTKQPEWMKEHIHFLVRVFRSGSFVKDWGKTHIGEDNAHIEVTVMCTPLRNDSNASPHYIQQHKLIIMSSGFLTTATPEQNHQLGRHISDVLCIVNRKPLMCFDYRTHSNWTVVFLPLFMLQSMLYNKVLGISASLFFKCTAYLQNQSELELKYSHENSQNICDEIELWCEVKYWSLRMPL